MILVKRVSEILTCHEVLKGIKMKGRVSKEVREMLKSEKGRQALSELITNPNNSGIVIETNNGKITINRYSEIDMRADVPKAYYDLRKTKEGQEAIGKMLDDSTIDEMEVISGGHKYHIKKLKTYGKDTNYDDGYPTSSPLIVPKKKYSFLVGDIFRVLFLLGALFVFYKVLC